MRTYITRRCAKMAARAITKMAAKAGVRVFAGVAVGVLLLGCGGAKNTAYVKDSSDYTLQNKSADKKLQALREQCKADDVDACRTLIDKGDIQGLQTLCDEKVSLACGAVGYHFVLQNDMSQAKLWYHKACELGNVEACFGLGLKYKNGEVGKQDTTKALNLFKKACDLDYGVGCAWAGSIYYNKQQYGKARKLYEKGCKLNSGDACYNLAVLYYHGKGARQDYKQAKELCGKACDLDNQEGCEGYKELKDEGY